MSTVRITGSLVNSCRYWDIQKWQDFNEAIDRAKDDCEKAGGSVEDNFTRARKNPAASSGRPGADHRLSRYACHLITMAARAPGAIAAHARTYFGDQVEAAEVMDAQIVAIEDLIQQARIRVETRDRLAGSYDQLEEVAGRMGMTRSAHFARIRVSAGEQHGIYI